MKLDQEARTTVCKNQACVGQLVRQLISWIELKDVLDIKGLGEAGIQSLLDNGVLSNASALFKLTEDTLNKAGIHRGVAESIIAQIKDLNSFDLHRWLCALGIPGLGKVRAIEISNHAGTNRNNDGIHFYNLEELIALMSDATFLSDLFGLDGLVIGNHVLKNQDEITKFLSHYDFTLERTPSLDGIPVAISGGWVAMPRNMLTDKLAEAGFVLSDKVTKSCKVLMIGEKPSASKIEKAKKYNIPVIAIRSLDNLKGMVAVLSN